MDYIIQRLGSKVYQIIDLDKAKKADQDLKQFLTEENDLGILRQELVSMLPLQLIDFEDNFICLDSCAAPGSKTLQLMEILYSNAQNKGILPRGVVWANELDNKRSKMLVHLIQNHPTLNLVVTKCDATQIPMNKSMQPDVVICDVPCSGDGTLRKSKQIKKSWGINYSYDKHEVQKKILENCINICKVGGSIAYSTCAINPIENEAVIASVLEKYSGIVELVDVSSKMNALNIKYRNGLIKWKVALDSTDFTNMSEDYSQSIINQKEIKLKNRTPICESMFHPVYTSSNFRQTVLFVSVFKQ